MQLKRLVGLHCTSQLQTHWNMLDLLHVHKWSDGDMESTCDDRRLLSFINPTCGVISKHKNDTPERTGSSPLQYIHYSLHTRCLAKHNALHWRHNKRDGVSNYQSHDCLLNCLFRRRSKKTSKLRVTDLCAWNSPVTGEFPAKGPVTRKIFPFDEVIIICRYQLILQSPSRYYSIPQVVL